MRRLLLATALLASACTFGPKPAQQASAALADVPMTAWEKQAWIAKAARVLRYGQGVTAAEMSQLMPLGRDAIVDRLMADPRFGDTVLDFNLYFLGFKPDSLFKSDDMTNTGGADKDNHSYADAVLSRPAAITAARNLVKGGDYLALFDMEQPVYVGHSAKPYLEDAQGNPVEGDPKEIRAKMLQKIVGAYDVLLAKFKPAGATDLNREAGCDGFNDDEQMGIVQNTVFSAGIGNDFALAVVARWNPGVNQLCGTGASAQQVVDEITAVKGRIARVFGWADLHMKETYKVTSILDLEAVDAPALDREWFGHDTTYSGFWSLLPVSSTNFDRKRAAYVLRTYFCDDLTPVAVVTPPAHAGSAHASQPSCQSCHYKLDPMAGFFRYRGFFGSNLYGQPYIAFDDNSSLSGPDMDRYYDSWKAPADAGRIWNVGYVRSTTKPETNVYAPDASIEPLADLHKIIRDSNESRQCLTQRMAEYFLGTKQAYDGGWLKGLAESYTTTASSSVAAKQVIKTLVLSNTFLQKNPSPGLCYDPPEAMNSPIPCEVSFIVKNSCMQGCHMHSDGFDLTDKAVLTEMDRRLNSADPDVRMPYNKDMPDPDRVKLIKWLQAKLGGQ